MQALPGAGFSCAFGEVHALLGENGAGKCTLFRVLLVLGGIGGRVRAPAALGTGEA